ncbi:PREDICTED: uncharacterized protein C6orf118-like [Branchiostoma belcheri]|uniref:Uncharacterized protein C6orf118-like n=1 Tax=Branchiostoma belcheri TaxID=7741 RepID=A0A6P5A7M5_BRABE|nr:PREDICTED: uncharacterized protein C6orf118-like [Branchiostoma belcheri]KAI8508363.1 hypothetical protein Bbelb_134620 [Branchiostoma belcheri]
MSLSSETYRTQRDQMMAETRTVREQELRRLMDTVLDKHRDDILTIASGHLNHDKLYKPPERATHQPWVSSGKASISLREPSVIPKGQKSVRLQREKLRQMSETARQFSMGTAGSLPATSLFPSPTGAQVSRSGGERSRTVLPSIGEKDRKDRERLTQSYPTQSRETYIDDNVRVEELNMPELLLHSPRRPAEPKTKSVDFAHKLRTMKDHTFMQSYLAGITKKEQFSRLKEFESDVMRMGDANERKVLTGQKAVDHHEAKLNAFLDELDARGDYNRLHRLQAHREVLDDLCEESPVFGDLLNKIKKEYDAYLSHLLESQNLQPRLLYEHLSTSSDKSPVPPGEVEEAMQQVRSLELQAKDLLSTNDRLRNELQEARESLATAEEEAKEPKSKLFVYKEAPPKEIDEQIRDLYAEILDNLDDMEAIRNNLQEEFVPLQVCQNLDHQLKETEIDIQRILKQNEYLEKQVQDLEEELEDYLEGENVPQRDARKLWRSINIDKVLSLGKMDY